MKKRSVHSLTLKQSENAYMMYCSPPDGIGRFNNITQLVVLSGSELISTFEAGSGNTYVRNVTDLNHDGKNEFLIEHPNSYTGGIGINSAEILEVDNGKISVIEKFGTVYWSDCAGSSVEKGKSYKAVGIFLKTLNRINGPSSKENITSNPVTKNAKWKRRDGGRRCRLHQKARPHLLAPGRPVGARPPPADEQGAVAVRLRRLISRWAAWSPPEARYFVCADYSFWSTDKFPTRRRAIPWEISLQPSKGHDSGGRRELIMGNGPRFEARKQRLFPSAIAHNRCSARDRAGSRA